MTNRRIGQLPSRRLGLAIAAMVWVAGLETTTVFADESQVREAVYTLESLNGGEVSVESSSLTLEQAIAKATAHSMAMVAQSRAEQASMDRSTSALQKPDPMLQLQLNNLPVSGNTAFNLGAEPITRKTIGISQKMVAGETLKAASEVKASQAELARALRFKAASEVKIATAQAWFDAFYAQQQLDVLLSLQQENRLQVDANKALYEGQMLSQATVFSAQIALEMLELQINEAQSRLANRLLELQRWTGEVSVPNTTASTNLNSLQLQQSLLLIPERYPQVQIQLAKEAAAIASADKVKRSLHPDWTLQLQFSDRGSAFSNTFSVAASRPLLTDPSSRQEREVAAAESLVAKAQAERIEAERQIVNEISQLLSDWQEARERLQIVNQKLIPLAEQRVQSLLETYRGATSSLGDLLLARRQVLDLQMQRIRIEREVAQLWVQLQYRPNMKEAL